MSIKLLDHLSCFCLEIGIKLGNLSKNEIKMLFFQYCVSVAPIPYFRISGGLQLPHLLFLSQCNILPLRVTLIYAILNEIKK